MREIKFRGKRKNDGEWVHGYLCTSIGYIGDKNPKLSIQEDGYFREVDPETVGQYTGLKDKNGTEVYGGDILRFTHERKEEGFINTNAIIIAEIPKIFLIINNPYNHSFEVIGNIYETPELVGGDSI